jgi:hypothetical protein
MIRSSCLAVAAVVAACSPGPRGNGVDASNNGSNTHDGAPAVCYEPGVRGKVMAGTADIQDCAVWNSVASMTGDVTLTRTATSLTMAFDTGITFTGTVTGNNVMLTYYQLHDFTDGCQWRATETLSGPMDPATCVMTLSYQYQETVESGDLCDSPCTGTADFNLSITPILQ